MINSQPLVMICASTLVAIPLGFLVYMHSQDNLDHLAFNHQSTPFVWPIAQPITSPTGADSPPSPPQYFTHQSFYGAVTIILFIDEVSEDLIHKLKQWLVIIDQKMAIREHFDESDLVNQGVLISDVHSHYRDDLMLSHQNKSGSWIHVHTSQMVRNDLMSFYRSIPSQAEPPTIPTMMVLIFDSTAHLRAVIDENALQASSLSHLRALVSRAHFQSSLDEYLRGRTFFGQKKSEKSYPLSSP